jgi:hypothetical protein
VVDWLDDVDGALDVVGSPSEETQAPDTRASASK